MDALAGGRVRRVELSPWAVATSMAGQKIQSDAAEYFDGLAFDCVNTWLPVSLIRFLFDFQQQE
jgi:hypothetical protein